jgi:hypothetical protein
MQRLLLVICAALLLAACTTSQPLTQQARSPNLQVKLTLDALAPGVRQAQIAISDRNGQPVEAETVIVAPSMSGMGHSNPELVAVRQGPGRYGLQGELFSMAGSWQLAVVVRHGGMNETVQFQFELG